ncbi:MAG TPA: S9 family peptidase [Vicinamibacterales bacterium]|jgi:dipeptidyl aminopeptidase/acylaminoacyl peptidase|nr:S9 family peptidase [Vicinamibacterales bacterium]
MKAFRARVVAVVAAFGVAAVAVLCAGRVLSGQSLRPMGLVDLLNVPRLGEPRLSPDGAEVVFTRADSDWKSGRRVTHIWRAHVGGGEPVQLTHSAEGETSPRWSPDGRTIAFTAKRGDDELTQIYLLPADGGEARRLTMHASAVSEISWTPDGTALYFSAPEPKTDDDKAREKAKDDIYAYDENFKQTHLWRVDAAGGTETRITGGDFAVTSYELSEDGHRIAYLRAPSPLLGDADRGEVWVADADGSHAVQVTQNTVAESGPALSPDNSMVLFTSGSNATFETYYNGRLFVAPAGGGSARVVVGEREPYDVSAATWSADGKSIYFLANLGVHEEVFVVPAAGGAPRQLTTGKHVVSAMSRTRNRFAFLIGDSTSGGEVYAMDETGHAMRVTHVFDYLARDFALGRQEAITWKGADGAAVEGILTYPADYQTGRKYPLAVMTHGGPQAADKYSIGSPAYEIQVLAGKGYAVLQPNYRGSTGYGDAFLRDMVGHYFQNAHLDVMAGVDEVIRRGVADPDRMVKMGWSAGGHMTNKIITFTDRFKAAAAGAGVAQWVSMYAQSDTRSYRTPWFGGTPWQKNAPIDAYWNNSPLKDVANVKTPTIFFVGERDPRVPMPQSIEMYHALKSNHVPTHLYVAPREPHGWAELRHNLYKMNAEIAWFEQYATRRPYTWEKAPGDDKDRKSTTDQP